MSFRAIACLVACLLGGGLQAQQATYVGSETCRDCHTGAFEAWQESHHAKAWTQPSSETIVADFDGAEFAHDGTLTRFRVEQDQFFVTVTEKDGVTTDYPVHSVAGIEPLQQYLLETEPGRLQSFDVVWDTENETWYHLYPEQDLPPDDGLHWTGPYKNWNARCAECHATGFEKNYDVETDSYSSTWAEIGVGCEACHGPGSAHNEWATTQNAPAPENYGFAMAFDAANPEGTIQQCATCHSRREHFLDGNPTPGTPFADAYNLALLRPGLYHSDGQILDEVYVYGSFVQSRMYAKGVACSNCHTPHGAGLIAEGNAVCTQCHSEAGNPDFPSLRLAEYNSQEHHFHPIDSEAAQCKSCHMIERDYMVVDGRRDHSFRVPRPDIGARTGSPDACTDCHEDQTQAWAADVLKGWYPESRKRGYHYGLTLARGTEDPVGSRSELLDLAKNRTQPDIARATALFLLERVGDAELAGLVAPLLEDENPNVRQRAVTLQRTASAQDKLSRVVPLLKDPTSVVRQRAAQQLLDVRNVRFPDAIAQDLRTAMDEWQAALGNRLDFPETHLAMGGLSLTRRDLNGAQAAFRKATEMDPQRPDAWVMLVRIAAVAEGEEAARAVLDEALAILPDDPNLKAFDEELN